MNSPSIRSRISSPTTRVVLSLLLGSAFAYCGGSPVREDFQKIQRIHLLGVAVVGPTYVTEQWLPLRAPVPLAGSRTMTQLQDLTTGGTDGDTRIVNGKLHITSNKYGPIGTSSVNGRCKDCNPNASYRIPLSSARNAASSSLQKVIYSNASAPLVAAAESLKLKGFREAQRHLENAVGSRADLPDHNATLKTYETAIQSPAFQEFLANHPEDAFLYVMVFLSPKLIPDTVESTGSEQAFDAATGQLSDRYTMEISVNVGWDSLALNARARPDMRYANKPGTNLLSPGDQGCLPTIFTIREFTTDPAKFGGSPAKYTFVNWFDMARKGARQNVFRIQGSTRGGTAATTAALHESLQNIMKPLGDEFVVRLNDYIAAVKK